MRAWRVDRLGASVNALWLVVLLRRRGIYNPGTGWARYGLRMLPGLFAMAAILWLASERVDWVALGAQPALRVAALAGVIGIAALAYFALLALCGFRLADFTRRRK